MTTSATKKIDGEEKRRSDAARKVGKPVSPTAATNIAGNWNSPP